MAELGELAPSLSLVFNGRAACLAGRVKDNAPRQSLIRTR